jgi:hypothetical protein
MIANLLFHIICMYMMYNMLEADLLVRKLQNMVWKPMPREREWERGRESRMTDWLNEEC